MCLKSVNILDFNDLHKEQLNKETFNEINKQSENNKIKDNLTLYIRSNLKFCEYSIQLLVILFCKSNHFF